MLESLLKKFDNYKDTCSITNVREGCVTFIRHSKYYDQYLKGVDKDILVITPSDFNDVVHPNIKIRKTDNPEYEFALYHNFIHADDPIPEPIIGYGCVIHSTALLNVEGIKVINCPDGHKMQFRHTGCVVIGHNVEIGPYSVVHRGTMDMTFIEDGVKIGAKTNIAHNNIIGKNTVFAAGAVTNGSVTIGRNCWISSGALIRNGVFICNNTVIGLGSVVVKDIYKPGIYVGNPAKYLKPVSEG